MQVFVPMIVRFLLTWPACTTDGGAWKDVSPLDVYDLGATVNAPGMEQVADAGPRLSQKVRDQGVGCR